MQVSPNVHLVDPACEVIGPYSFSLVIGFDEDYASLFQSRPDHCSTSPMRSCWPFRIRGLCCD